MRESLLLHSTNIVVYPNILLFMGFTLLYLIRSFRCSIFKVRFYDDSRLPVLLPFGLLQFACSHPSGQVLLRLSVVLVGCLLYNRRLVGTSGFEPPTSRLSGVRSNHLSYAPISSGGDEEDRTPDPLRARQVLSQLSYTPI